MSEISLTYVYDSTSDGRAFVRWKSPNQRAEDLLVSHMTPVQKKDWERFQYFDAVGNVTGRTYRIHNAGIRNISRIVAGKSLAEYCAQACGYVPACDEFLAQKLAIEANEAYFLKTANKTLSIYGLAALIAAALISLGTVFAGFRF